jgi:hypothetical protein
MFMLFFVRHLTLENLQGLGTYTFQFSLFSSGKTIAPNASKQSGVCRHFFPICLRSIRGNAYPKLGEFPANAVEGVEATICKV